MTFDFSFHKSKKDRQYNGQKIPKEKSKVINQRRTGNTMDKRYQRRINISMSFIMG
jgi:hypothetical protein